MADHEEVLRIDVRGIPELVYGCRLEMAKQIRVIANNELNPRVKERLIHVAASFETASPVDALSTTFGE